MGQTYFSDSDMEAIANVSEYDPKNPAFQKVYVSYMYGLSAEAAGRMIPSLSESELANAFDYYQCKDLPTGDRLSVYESRREARESIEREFGLSPLDGIRKRDEGFPAKPSLGDALTDLGQETGLAMR